MDHLTSRVICSSMRHNGSRELVPPLCMKSSPRSRAGLRRLQLPVATARHAIWGIVRARHANEQPRTVHSLGRAKQKCPLSIPEHCRPGHAFW